MPNKVEPTGPGSESGTAPSPPPLSKALENVRQIILKNVTTLPWSGPRGQIVCWDPANVEPIITGENSSDVLMVGAVKGAGRALVFSNHSYILELDRAHEALLLYSDDHCENVVIHQDSSFDTMPKRPKSVDQGIDDLQVFRQNCYKWVTENKYDSTTWKVINLDRVSRSGLQTLIRTSHHDDNKVVLLIDGSQTKLLSKMAQDVLDFVESGGSVIIGACGWKIAQKTSLEKSGVQMILVDLGMSLTPTSVQTVKESVKDMRKEQKSYDVKVNKASQAHFGRRLMESGKQWHLDDSQSMYFCKVLSDLQYKVPVEYIVLLQGYLGLQPHGRMNLHMADMDKSFPWPLKRPLHKLAVFSTNTILNSCHEMETGKPPLLQHFPFDFKERRLTLMDSDLECLTPNRSEVYPTGWYVPAGVELFIRGKGLKDFKVIIGSHINIPGDGRLPVYRYPSVTSTKVLQQNGGTLRSYFGGLVYLESPDVHHEVTYQLLNVVPAPHYDISDKDSISDWQDSRRLPGLWCDIVGQFFILTLPSNSVRNIDNPEKRVKFFDDAIYAIYRLQGCYANTFPRHWFVCDVIPANAKPLNASNLYYHSIHSAYGNPDSKYFFFGNQLVDSDKWEHLSGLLDLVSYSLYKHLGWPVEEGDSVFPTISLLYVYDKLLNLPSWEHPCVKLKKANMKAFVASKPTSYEKWKLSKGTGIGPFVQIARDFGWKSLQRAFSIFNSMTKEEKPSNMDPMAQMEILISICCKVTKCNLVDSLFDHYGLRVSKETRTKLESEKLEKYRPWDEISSEFVLPSSDDTFSLLSCCFLKKQQKVKPDEDL